MFSFDLQLFGGKGGGTTTVKNEPAPLTDDQKRLQKASADYAEYIQPSAYKLYDTAVAGVNNALNPDYSNLYKQQQANTAALQQQYNNWNGGLLSDLSRYNNQSSAVNARNDDNSRYVGSVMDDAASRNNANSQYLMGINNAATARTNANSGLLRADTALVNQQLRSNSIPDSVMAARQGTINRMAKSSIGNLLAQQAQSGTIGSDAYADGLRGISDSVSNTLENNYSNDLAQYNSAMQQSLGNTSNYVNTDNGLAQQGVVNAGNYVNLDNATTQQRVANAGNWADYDTQVGQQGLTNTGNAMQQRYNMGQGLLSQGINMGSLGLQQANQAQQASYQLPMQLLAASQGQFTPTNQIWQNANNGSTTTQTTSGGGGLFGGLLGAGTYALGQSWGRKW